MGGQSINPNQTQNKKSCYRMKPILLKNFTEHLQKGKKKHSKVENWEKLSLISPAHLLNLNQSDTTEKNYDRTLTVPPGNLMISKKNFENCTFWIS